MTKGNRAAVVRARISHALIIGLGLWMTFSPGVINSLFFAGWLVTSWGVYSLIRFEFHEHQRQKWG